MQSVTIRWGTTLGCFFWVFLSNIANLRRHELQVSDLSSRLRHVIHSQSASFLMERGCRNPCRHRGDGRTGVYGDVDHLDWGMFNGTYSLGQVLGGMKPDFFGPHVYLSASLAHWSISLALIGLSTTVE